MKNPLSGAWNALRARIRTSATRFAFFGRNHAGVHITHDSAMQNAAVWACIDGIASPAASTDWNVYSGTRGADKKTALPDDGLQYVLNARFNPEMTAQSGKRALMISAVGFGNGYAEIERDMAGRIIGLWPLDPSRVELRRDTETLGLFYRVSQQRDGGPVDLQPWEVFHIRGAGLTGFAGDDPVGRAIQSIAAAVALDQFSAAYFGNGAQPGVVLRVPGLKKLPEPEYNRLKEQWSERHQGPRNAFRVGFIDDTMKIDKLEVDADKAQMIEAKYLSIEEICRWFRMPPHKIAHLLRATNNNIEHQGLEFSRDTFRPWKVEIEQECDWSLVPVRGPKKFVELDVDWMEQGDYGTRATAYSTLRGCGVFTVNDVLRKLGENTGGPECDIRTMNGASMPLEDVGKNMVPNQRQLPAPRRADDEPDEEDIEPVQNWLQAIYQRIQRRMENRRADLERAGRTDAARVSQLDAMQYTAQALEEIMPTITAKWPDAAMQVELGALAVVRGTDPAEAAATVTARFDERIPA